MCVHCLIRGDVDFGQLSSLAHEMGDAFQQLVTEHRAQLPVTIQAPPRLVVLNLPPSVKILLGFTMIQTQECHRVRSLRELQVTLIQGALRDQRLDVATELAFSSLPQLEQLVQRHETQHPTH